MIEDWRMRIGIDATALPAQPLGAGRYMLELVRALGSVAPSERFIVFVASDRRHLFRPSAQDNVEFVEVAPKPVWRRLMWEQSALPRLCKSHQIDLLHCPHYTMPAWKPCPIVVTFHDLTFFLMPRYHLLTKRIGFRWAMRMSSRRADGIIVVSESTRRDALSILGIPPRKIHTVWLGVGPEYRPVRDASELARIRRLYELPASFLLYVGAIEPRKNIPLLVSAFEQLLERGVDHDLVLVGSLGWKYGGILRRIQQSPARERIRRLGYVSPADLPVIYSAATALVYPSHYEGFGLPLIEAMACGTPVIGTRISSLPEIMGDAGVLVSPNSKSQLVAAMEKVIADPAFREELAREGLKRAAEFTWTRTARKTLQVYRKAREGFSSPVHRPGA